jgi:hypothetical protein
MENLTRYSLHNVYGIGNDINLDLFETLLQGYLEVDEELPVLCRIFDSTVIRRDSSS